MAGCHRRLIGDAFLFGTVSYTHLLAENGIDYVGNWVNDDQPYPMRVKKGSMIAMPYSTCLLYTSRCV